MHRKIPPKLEVQKEDTKEGPEEDTNEALRRTPTRTRRKAPMATPPTMTPRNSDTHYEVVEDVFGRMPSERIKTVPAHQSVVTLADIVLAGTMLVYLLH